MNKTHALILSLVPCMAASAQVGSTEGTPPPLIIVTQIANKEVQTTENKSGDEGTNNPVVTGSQEYIQGEKKYYLKQNANITILFEEKLP